MRFLLPYNRCTIASFKKCIAVALLIKSPVAEWDGPAIAWP